MCNCHEIFMAYIIKHGVDRLGYTPHLMHEHPVQRTSKGLAVQLPYVARVFRAIAIVCLTTVPPVACLLLQLDEEGAAAAMKALDGADFEGRTIVVRPQNPT
jgi:hypothetical protein